MRKNYVKFYIFIIAILLLSSPIIYSMPNICLTDQKNSSQSYELKNSIINPKIEVAIQMVNESMLREFLYYLSVEIGIRVTGTYGTEKAAKYIYEQFSDMGLDTKYNYWQGFSLDIPPRFFKDKNVEATLQGKNKSCDEILVFNAHYDTGITSPGAVDDGTGTAAVLTAAYVLSHFEFNRTIKFVTFSGEEEGLIGSRNYVRDIYKNDTDVLAEFNADMIGYANTAEEGRTVLVSQTEDAKWITNEIKNVNENYGLNLNIIGAWDLTAEGQRHGSDFFDFVLHGYEAIAFWESGGYNFAHTSNDTYEKVNFSYLVNMTKLIVASLAHMADIDVYYPQVKIGAPKHGIFYIQGRTLKEFKYEQTIVLDNIMVYADVKPGNAPIEKVVFSYDGKNKSICTEKPYAWRLNERSIGKKHTITVTVFDDLGRTASDKISFRFFNLNRKV